MKCKPRKPKTSPKKGASGKRRAKLQITSETERKAPASIGGIDSGVKVAVDL